MNSNFSDLSKTQLIDQLNYTSSISSEKSKIINSQSQIITSQSQKITSQSQIITSQSQIITSQSQELTSKSQEIKELTKQLNELRLNESLTNQNEPLSNSSNNSDNDATKTSYNTEIGDPTPADHHYSNDDLCQFGNFHYLEVAKAILEGQEGVILEKLNEKNAHFLPTPSS